MTTPDATPQLFEHNEIEISREMFRVSMRDAEFLYGYRYQRNTPHKKGRSAPEAHSTPVLMIPSELGNVREYHAAALELLSLDGCPEQVLMLDLRGRGLSISASPADTDASTDADDIISVADALNFHHLDVLVTGRSSAAVLMTLPKRPGLIRSLVLNDAAPEYDSVGIARETALRQRQSSPNNWNDAFSLLKHSKGEQFSDLTDENWMEMARARWRDDDGAPTTDYNPALQRSSNAVSYDEKQTTLWPEFAILNSRAVMLIRGENSAMVTAEIESKIKKAHSSTQVRLVEGQGHSPLLHTSGLMGDVLSFLHSTTSTT